MPRKTTHFMNFATACLTAGVLTLAAAPAMAQSDRDRGDDQRDARRQDRDVQLERASDVIGREVENNTGEEIGTIEDLAINRRTGEVRYAIVDRSGAAGVPRDAEMLYAVPLTALRFTGDNKVVRLDVSKERMEDAPPFANSGWNTIGDERWGEVVFEFYGQEPRFTDDDDDDEDDRDRKDADRANADNQAGAFIQGSRAVGLNVKNDQNEDLGEVEDIMLDVRSGQVVYAVIGFDRVREAAGRNDDEKLFAVPWQALRHREAQDAFIVSIDRDRLRDAPGFDRRDWPDMNDIRWARNVHDYYGAEPSWVYGFEPADDDQDNRDDPRGPQAGDRGVMEGWQALSEYGKLFNPRTIETVRGRVVEIASEVPMRGMSEVTIIRLRTERDSEAIDVHLGPEWFIHRQQSGFKAGDDVQVSGSRIELNGRDALMAMEMRHADRVMVLRNRNGRPVWDAWQETDSDRSLNDNDRDDDDNRRRGDR